MRMRDWSSDVCSSDLFGISVGGRISRNEVTGKYPLLDRREESNDTIFIPKVTLSYDFNEDVMAYATFSKGFEPGRVNSGALGLDDPAGVVSAPFMAEVATNYGAGPKGAVADGKLVFELAGFYIKTTDRQGEHRALTGVKQGQRGVRER